MRLSVILPCFNGAKTIDVQLEALASQQWDGDWELIVVNNGSTDDSMAIVERYRDRFPHLHIVDAYEPGKPRLGVAHSDNRGVQAATGDAFCFCESDDEVCPGWLAGMADALSHYEFVTGPLEYTRLNEPWLVAAMNHGKWNQSEGLMETELDNPPYLPFAYGCNLGMRRSVYEKVGEFDTTLYAAWDTDYCWRVQLAGIKLHFIPDLVVHYRMRHELKAIYRQAKSWGIDRVQLFSRYNNKPFGWSVFLQELGSIVPGVAVYGSRLFVMRLLNIRRGKGAFALWWWGMSYKLGFLEGLLKREILPSFIGSR